MAAGERLCNINHYGNRCTCFDFSFPWIPSCVTYPLPDPVNSPPPAPTPAGSEGKEWAPRPFDRGIAHIVEVLRANGIETFESCEGSIGHALSEPTVMFHGNDSEGFKALAIALTHNLRPYELRRYWQINGREPVGPYWALVFVIPPDRTRKARYEKEDCPVCIEHGAACVFMAS